LISSGRSNPVSGDVHTSYSHNVSNHTNEQTQDRNQIEIKSETIMSAVRRILEDDFDRKCYSFSMGHINPAKLANFPEIEIYVLLSSSLTSCFDSKFGKK